MPHDVLIYDALRTPRGKGRNGSLHGVKPVSLVVGLLVAVFQAATQLNEQTLSFIPKLLAVAATMVLAGPWIVAVIDDYTRGVLTNIPNYVN